MANRNLKNRQAISTAIDLELYEKFKIYSQKTMIPMSKLFDEAIKQFLEDKVIDDTPQ